MSCLSLGDFPDPGIELTSPAFLELQVDFLPLKYQLSLLLYDNNILSQSTNYFSKDN